MTRFDLQNGSFLLDRPASVWICLDGEGIILSPDGETPVRKGDYFFLPAAAAGAGCCAVKTRGSVKFACCMGGK